jgi:subtilase family serine protease
MATFVTSPLTKFYAIGLLALSGAFTHAQALPQRISAAVEDSYRVALAGSQHPLAQSRFETGRMAASTQLTGMKIVFSRSAEQETELQSLLAAQHDPSSSLYHQWLTPAQFNARFGVSAADAAKVTAWLQQQGFTVDSAAQSSRSIRFSGTVGQVEKAFRTEMHYYSVAGESVFAPSSALSIPEAFTPAVLSVSNLSNFRAKPHVKRLAPQPAFTSYKSGSVYFTPGDIAVAYNIDKLTSSTSTFSGCSGGCTGAGQTIVVVGQSAIVASDITKFQNAAGLTAKAPTQTLVPGTGTSTIYSGDEGESDLDIEWAGGIAPGASINFVYTGNSSSSSGIFDAMEYAIEQGLGNIITASYGACETAFASSDISAYEVYTAQAAAQGQTIVASSGDDGSSACYEYYDGGSNSGFTSTQLKALSVNYPASSAYVTGLGGTEIPGTYNSALVTSGGDYWSAKSSSDIITTLLQYPTESAWNDDTSSGLSSGGGGVSTSITRPSWQNPSTNNISGLPATSTYSKRLVPDISGYSSPSYPGFLYCSSDSTTGVTGSCSNGFRDSTTYGYLTVAGGTSFAAPIFAGMAAILNQATGNTNGQGLLNTELYALAANSADYASAFHDITTGGPSATSGVGNECTSGTTTYCSTASAASYHSTTGYDMATGLGSVDLYALASIWPTSSSSSSTCTGSNCFSLAASPGSSSSSPLTITQGNSGSATITITSKNSYAGTMNFELSASTSDQATWKYGCYTIDNQSVSANGTATTTLTIYTSSSLCSSISGKSLAVNTAPHKAPWRQAIPAGGFALAGVLLFGLRKRRAQWLGMLGCLLLIGVLSAAVGCNSTNSSSSSSSSGSSVTKGSYTMTLTGTDSSDSARTTSVSLYVTVN